MIARLLRSALLALAVTGLTACAGEEAPEPKKPEPKKPEPKPTKPAPNLGW